MHYIAGMKGHHIPHSEAGISAIAAAVNAHHDELGYRAKDGMKKCRACGKTMPESAFCSHKRKNDGLRTNCRDCEKEKQKQHYQNNLDRERERGRANGVTRREQGKTQEYEAKNKTSLNAVRKLWRENNKLKCFTYYLKRREFMPDYMVANCLRMNLNTAPPELIELKREQLLMHRATKQLIESLKEKQNGTE